MNITAGSTIKFDKASGEVREYIEDTVASVIKVREQIADRVIRDACIEELRRRGYVVTGP